MILSNLFWPSFRSGFPKIGYIKEQSHFLSPIFSVFLHPFITRTTHIPISARRSFFTSYSLSVFLDLPLLLLLYLHQKTCHSSCRPLKSLRLYLPSNKASDRTITEPYYQTFHTHIAPILTFFVLGLRHPCSSPSVRLFFFMLS